MTGGMCPAGCGRGVRPGNLMCYACWAQVPKSLQRELERAFQAVHGVRDTGSELRVEAALERYRKAYVAATHAVQVLRPPETDVDALRSLLDAMENFPNNDQRARYLLSSNWMRDRDARRTEGESA